MRSLKLKRMHEKSCKTAKTIMAMENKVESHFVVLMPDGEIGCILAPWRSREDKADMTAQIRMIIKQQGITMYSFISEAWIATVDPRTQKELMNVPARERSDREDVLMIITRDIDGENYMTRYHVEYDVDGKVTLGKPLHLNIGSDGHMANLFD